MRSTRSRADHKHMTWEEAIQAARCESGELQLTEQKAYGTLLAYSGCPRSSTPYGCTTRSDLHSQPTRMTPTRTGARIHALHQSRYVEGKFTELDAEYDSGRSLIIPRFLADLLRQAVEQPLSCEWVFTASKSGRLLRGGDWYAYIWHPMVKRRPARPVVRGARARVGLPQFPVSRV